MKRGFEKISFSKFKDLVCDDETLYNKFPLPKRSTYLSAGYDIYSLEEKTVKAHCSEIFKTGLKVKMMNDEVLLIVVRSSIGFKYDVSLSNNVGVIDSDYYNNIDNEGHICIKLINHSSKDFEVKKFDRIAQGIFTKYLTVDCDSENNIRTGGYGSTGK